MIKLVASDLDGTILRNGAQSVDASTIEVIDKLLSAGVLFAPASGRQIVSLKRLFEPVSDRLVYISENGALSEYKGEVIAKTAMDRKLALKIIEDVDEQPRADPHAEQGGQIHDEGGVDKLYLPLHAEDGTRQFRDAQHVEVGEL